MQALLIFNVLCATPYQRNAVGFHQQKGREIFPAGKVLPVFY